jgi:hypothetical protein
MMVLSTVATGAAHSEMTVELDDVDNRCPTTGGDRVDADINTYNRRCV